MTGSTSSLAELLLADGPAADRADKMGLYSWLIGAWEMDTTVFADDGQRLTGHGKIRFGWALEGRAIQDVWILPGLFYGTTLRIYDPGIDAWHIIWSDPVRQYFARQIGRAQGEDIVQLGKTASGVALRWSFTEITPNSFRWLGERSFDEQATWHLQAEYLVRRVVTR
jgi:hypothetical protein